MRNVFTDAQRLDFLEREANEDPLVLHNLEFGARNFAGMRGLGLACTGRSLREALDQMMYAAGEHRKASQ